VWPETQEICDALGLEPLGLIASGSLLLAVRPECADEMEAALPGAHRIGLLLPPGEGSWLIEAGVRRPLPVFARDELARYFDEAQQRR
jgi:hydrogenase expression/formation protein HypE